MEDSTAVLQVRITHKDISNFRNTGRYYTQTCRIAQENMVAVAAVFKPKKRIELICAKFGKILPNSNSVLNDVIGSFE